MKSKNKGGAQGRALDGVNLKMSALGRAVLQDVDLAADLKAIAPQLRAIPERV